MNADQIPKHVFEDLNDYLSEADVTYLKDGYWKMLAILLAEKHKEDARFIVSEICKEGEQRIKQQSLIAATIQDSLIEFRLEAKQYNLC